jgi:hypothetical protein
MEYLLMEKDFNVLGKGERRGNAVCQIRRIQNYASRFICGFRSVTTTDIGECEVLSPNMFYVFSHLPAMLLHKRIQMFYVISNCNMIKEIGLEVNVEETKYVVISRDQNAEQNSNIKIDNKSFETVEQFKYLGTTLTNRNSIHAEIKSRLKSGNALLS